MAAADDLIRLRATEAVALLRRGEVSPLELIDAAAARIEAVNPTINALPTLCLERAREQAEKIDRNAAGKGAGWLAGLPVAVKDYNDVAGVKTTYGSPIFADNIAQTSDKTVRRLEASGAIPIAKSNVPEWAGANTFNSVFGPTVNPWNTDLSVGGSSGGSAAALATGMVWLATGNDLGGSLRTPASFCSVVGLRPSPGRVPGGPDMMPFDPMWVEGPMGRTVADVALMLDAEVGYAPDDPLTLPAPDRSFIAALTDDIGRPRIGFSPDLGIVPIDKEVAHICAAAVRRCSDFGATVDDGCPDFADAVDAFQVLRARLIATVMEDVLAEHRDRIKPDIVWNIEKGLALTADQVTRAERERAALYQRMVAFFGDYDVLACPAASVPPFPVSQNYVEEINGEPCETYIDWIAITFAITLTSCPSIAVPRGFTADGLPIGVQLVGKPRAEAALLAIAQRFEDTMGIAAKTPIDPIVRPA
jgi:amidase